MGIGIHIGRFVKIVDHHAGTCAGRFFYIPDPRVIHRHIARILRLAVCRRKYCGLRQRPHGHFFPLGDNNRVGARDIFGMKPYIPFGCGF